MIQGEQWMFVLFGALIGFSMGYIFKDNYKDGYITSISKDKFENGLVHTEYHTITFADGSSFWIEDLKHWILDDYLTVGMRIKFGYNPKHMGILSWDVCDSLFEDEFY